MSDGTFQRPGSVQRQPQEPWPYTSPGFPAPSEPIWSPRPPSCPQKQLPQHPPVSATRTARLGGTASMGAAGLLAGMVIGVISTDSPPARPIPIAVDSFPLELLGQMRAGVEWPDHSSAPVVEVDEAAFESQLASHRFAYGGDGASFVYGSSYELTIVNGFLAVSVPSAGDPPSGDVPTVVSLRSSDALCVSQQPTIDFEQRPPHHPPREGRQWEAEAVAAAGPHAGARYAWTDCVLVDLQRHLTLKLRGNGPASNILGTASQFRDALRQVHAALPLPA